MDMTFKCCCESPPTFQYTCPAESKLCHVNRNDVIRFIRKSFKLSLLPFMKRSNISDFVLEQMDCDTFLIYAIQPDCLGLLLNLDELKKIMNDVQFLWRLMTSDDPVPQVLFTELMGSVSKLLQMLDQPQLALELNRIAHFDQP